MRAITTGRHRSSQNLEVLSHEACLVAYSMAVPGAKLADIEIISIKTNITSNQINRRPDLKHSQVSQKDDLPLFSKLLYMLYTRASRKQNNLA